MRRSLSAFAGRARLPSCRCGSYRRTNKANVCLPLNAKLSRNGIANYLGHGHRSPYTLPGCARHMLLIVIDLVRRTTTLFLWLQPIGPGAEGPLASVFLAPVFTLVRNP